MSLAAGAPPHGCARHSRWLRDLRVTHSGEARVEEGRASGHTGGVATTTGTSARTHPSTASRVRRQAVFALAVGQLVAAVALSSAGGQPGGPGGVELLVQPAGWTFSVWGLIVAGCLGYGLYQLFYPRGDAAACAGAGWPLAGVQVGFVLWLVLSATAPIWTTVIVLLAMVALLAIAYTRALAQRRSLPLLPRTLLLATLGLYTGWAAVALVLNVATALLEAGLPSTGGGATAWQLVALLAVVAAGAAVVLRWRARLFSTVAVVWALVGTSVGTAGQGAPLLAGLAVAATVAMVAFAVWLRWNDLKTRAETALVQSGRGGATVTGTVVDADGRPQDPAAGGPRMITWTSRRR